MSEYQNSTEVKIKPSFTANRLPANKAVAQAGEHHIIAFSPPVGAPKNIGRDAYNAAGYDFSPLNAWLKNTVQVEAFELAEDTEDAAGIDGLRNLPAPFSASKYLPHEIAQSARPEQFLSAALADNLEGRPAVNLPLAAWQAKADGTFERLGIHPEQPCAWLSPCHWQVGMNDIVMHAPHTLQLTAQAAQTLIDGLQPYFATEGLQLYLADPLNPTQWLCSAATDSTTFRGWACTSLDRVFRDSGGPLAANVSPALMQGEQSGAFRRLQNEVQMLLYNHPHNDARSRAGLPTVSALWLHGAGALGDAAQSLPAATVHYGLREAFLNQDPAAHAAAWQALQTTLFGDSKVSANAENLVPYTPHGPKKITLCGLHKAVSFELVSPTPVQHTSFWGKLTQRLTAGKNAPLTAAQLFASL